MSTENKPTRKTQQPSYEVVKRSMDKIYRQFSVKLRREEDAELIDYLDRRNTEGVPITAVLRELYTSAKERGEIQ